MVKKKNYNVIKAKNIPDEKLSIIQLRSLLNYKKRKNDVKFSHMKKDQLKSMWLEWKHRLGTPLSYEFNLCMYIELFPVGNMADIESELEWSCICLFPL